MLSLINCFLFLQIYFSFFIISAKIPQIQGLALNLRNFDFIPRVFLKVEIHVFSQKSSWQKKHII